MHDGGMSELPLTGYQQEDQEGFARLVEDVHSEFGFSYDAELDVVGHDVVDAGVET